MDRKHQLYRAVTVLTILVSVTALVRAEPSVAVNKLMGEAVSAFTFGMYLTDKAIREEHDRLKEVDGGVYITTAVYNWDQNEIQLLVQSRSKDKQAVFEEKCRKIVYTLRLRGGVADGKKLMGSVAYSQHFAPIGYENKKNKDLPNKLDNIFVVHYNSGKHSCSAQVLGEGYSIKRQ